MIKKSFKVSLILILLIAFFWLIFSVIVAFGLHPALPDSKVYLWVLALLSFLTGSFLLFLYFLLRSRNKTAYYLTISFLFFITILTIMDELGVIDFVVLMITLIPIILLIKDRKWYLHKPEYS